MTSYDQAAGEALAGALARHIELGRHRATARDGEGVVLDQALADSMRVVTAARAAFYGHPAKPASPPPQKPRRKPKPVKSAPEEPALMLDIPGR